MLVRRGRARLLAGGGFTVVGQAGTLAGLLELVASSAPDLVITVIRMPPGMRDEGIIATEQIRATTEGRTAVLVLSQ